MDYSTICNIVKQHPELVNQKGTVQEGKLKGQTFEPVVLAGIRDTKLAKLLVDNGADRELVTKTLMGVFVIQITDFFDIPVDWNR